MAHCAVIFAIAQLSCFVTKACCVNLKTSPLTGSDEVKDTDGKAKAKDTQHKSKSLCSDKSSKVRLWDLWPVNTLLFYSAFATRLILCFLSLHKQQRWLACSRHSTQTDTTSCVRIDGCNSEWFPILSGVRQGCADAPDLFL